MQTIRFSTEGNPDIYISESLAQTARNVGVIALESSRDGLNEIAHLAAGDKAIEDIGGIVLQGPRDTWRDLNDEKVSYYHVPDDLSLADAVKAEPLSRLGIRAAAEAVEAKLLHVHTRGTSETRLSRNIYRAAQDQMLLSRMSSKEFFVYGGKFMAIGAGLGLLNEGLVDSGVNTISFGDAIPFVGPYVSSAIFGGMAGVGILGPAWRQVQKARATKAVRSSPPIRVHQAPGGQSSLAT